jgi:hypothetical protein
MDVVTIALDFIAWEAQSIGMVTRIIAGAVLMVFGLLIWGLYSYFREGK